MWTFETITPELARQIWDAQSPTRREAMYFHRERAEELAALMSNGHWQVRPIGLIFREDGSLQDGQHRIKAIILSRLTIRIWVWKMPAVI
jgi:hypothetical protein